MLEHSVNVGPCLPSRFGNHVVFEVGEIITNWISIFRPKGEKKARMTEAISAASRVALGRVSIRGMNTTFSALKKMSEGKKLRQENAVGD